MSTAHSVEGSRRTSRETASQGAPPDSLVADIITVFTLTVSLVGFAVSMAVLIFGGVLEAGMPRAVGSFVIGGGIMAIVVARRSQIVPVATFVQEGPGLVMAAVVADFVAREGADVSDVFVLLVVTMLATSIGTGLLAHFGLGGLGRFMPVSVVGAFAGGIGWLALKGGFDVMTTSDLSLVDLGRLFAFDIAKFWLPGVVTGVAAWLSGRSRRLPGFVVGAIVAASLAIFYVVVALASSLDAVESGGWLLGPFPDAGGNTVVTPNEFRGANWWGIARTSPGIASVVALACVSQLLHLTGIRAEVAPGLDVDDELRTSARANLSAAFFGVTPGSQGFGYTVLLDRLGATRRAVAVVSGGLVVIFGLVGVSTIGYVPRLVVGALLVMIGMALLEDWVRGLKRSTSIPDQVLGVGIVGVVAWLGLLQGVGLGLVAACAIFVVRYSGIDPVRPAPSRRQSPGDIDLSSTEVERPSAEDRLIVLELQGFIFFGSLATLEDHIHEAVRNAPPLATLLLDFTNVTGVDASGCQTVARLVRELSLLDVVTWISSADAELRKALGATHPDLAPHVVFFSSLGAAHERAAAASQAVPSSNDRLQTCGHQIPWSELGHRRPATVATFAG